MTLFLTQLWRFNGAGGGISRRGRRMRLSACDFGDVTRGGLIILIQIKMQRYCK